MPVADYGSDGVSHRIFETRLRLAVGGEQKHRDVVDLASRNSSSSEDRSGSRRSSKIRPTGPLDEAVLISVVTASNTLPALTYAHDAWRITIPPSEIKYSFVWSS